MNIENILNAEAELTHKSQPTPVVLSTRVRLARNLDSYPFPGWAGQPQRMEIAERCREALAELPVMDNGHVVDISELSALEKQVLVERHLISRELSQAEAGSLVVISKDQAASVMINEEDHLRIQVVRSGYNFKRIWKMIDGIDTGLEDGLDMAFSADLGYLTACPTNVGTGLRASVMMHLPGLVLANQMEKVVRAVNQLGIAVRGLFGEGSDASGSIFQISNQQTLGESENDIIKRLSSVLNTIIEQEENARIKLFESDANKLFDKIGRAFGILGHGHVLSSSESMNHLSLLRLAVDLKLLPEEYRGTIDRLFIECQPGHVQFAAKELIESEKRDVQRAALLRTHMAELPRPNFDNFSLTD